MWSYNCWSPDCCVWSHDGCIAITGVISRSSEGSRTKPTSCKMSILHVLSGEWGGVSSNDCEQLSSSHVVVGL